ncbi:hypothetical protein [Zobellia uliginosa]|uniref:hypothetical protein n=1 Tax=Zobellia uliginosa TaxID=143224 RepID=UPI0026E1504E|nr:hypothetical protein [Zobellia uliginosa]MDO6517805.1 hypothetical protein [Zobellia uliginosa]
MIRAYQNFFWNTFWGIFADRGGFFPSGFFALGIVAVTPQALLAYANWAEE